MKNAGLAGAIALCGIGLISPYPCPLAVHASVEAGQEQDETGACVSDEALLVWFDDQPQALCIGPTVFARSGLCSWILDLDQFPNQSGFKMRMEYMDINGDGVSERLVVPSATKAPLNPQNCLNFACTNFSMEVSGGDPLEWDSDLGFVTSNDGTDCLALTEPPGLILNQVRSVDAGWSLVEQAISFEYESVIPDTTKDWLIFTTVFDVDTDGRPDLLCILLDVTTADYWTPPTSSAVWFRNITGPEPLNADINRDGAVDGIDLAYVLNAWTA